MNVINKTTSVAVLIALGLALGAMAANAAESPSAPNYGAADFKPTPQQPLGFQADGNGWYPGATAPFAGVLGEYYATHECSDLLWTGPGQNAPAVLGGRHVWTRPWDDMRDPPIMVVYAFYGHSQVDGGAAGTLEHGNRVWLLDDKENLWRRAGENGSGPIEPFLDALAARHPGVWFGGLKMVQYGSDLSKNMSKGTRAYQSLIERIRLALGHPATRLGGVACIIGYGDLDRKPSEKQFAEEYIALIDSMRRDLAEPDLPFVVSQIEPVRGGKRDLGWQPIHSAIASLPGLRKHVAVAPANDLFRDAIHYTGPGYRRWGNEAAAEVLKQSLLDPVLARSRGEDGERLAGRVGVSPPPNQVLAVVEARLV